MIQICEWKDSFLLHNEIFKRFILDTYFNDTTISKFETRVFENIHDIRIIVFLLNFSRKRFLGCTVWNGFVYFLVPILKCMSSWYWCALSSSYLLGSTVRRDHSWKIRSNCFNQSQAKFIVSLSKIILKLEQRQMSLYDII